MTKEHWIGIIIILALITIALSGGAKKSSLVWPISPSSSPVVQSKTEVAEKPAGSSGAGGKVENANITNSGVSKYSGLISLKYVSRSEKPEQEYVTIQANNSQTKSILVTGWTLKSLASGQSAAIPKGTPLFFSNTINSDEDIYLRPGETLYLSTGLSPNGTSFKVNKCSGYLTQFQTFTPYISSICPRASDEDLSKIPKYVWNDSCFDYIDSYPRCKIQTDIMPVTWSVECKDFINKLNYPSCVNAHKNDGDFYLPEWRVFLRRNQPIWKSKRENIVLYDNFGKVVSTISY
ncbi:MAG: hypothetical protein HY507_00265 [Candidatus Zambryskibacteria bacterium]|nr:hypothetical protein [Candidatus Zambryskibacteria bacterium]